MSAPACARNAGIVHRMSVECPVSSANVLSVELTWQGNNKQPLKTEDTTMPRADGTGPMGMGAMTGRAAGYCAGSRVPGYANPVPGGGLRRSRPSATPMPRRVAEALEKYPAGKLTEAKAADVEGHWV